jgi:hypothetical protein
MRGSEGSRCCATFELPKPFESLLGDTCAAEGELNQQPFRIP